MKHVVVLALAFVIAGCSAASDFEKICHAEERSGAKGVQDPSEKAMKMAQWIEANISSSDAKKTMQALASVDGVNKGAILKQAAKESGYDGPCPIADEMAPPPPPTPPTPPAPIPPG